MNIYTNKTFKGHYPVGSAAVVCAENANIAASELNKELARMGLNPDVSEGDMELMPRDTTMVRILHDGDY